MAEPQCQIKRDRCPHAAESAEIAVKRVFAILGVDVDAPKEVEEFRENLRFGASMRRAADRGQLALVVMLVTAVGALLWAGIVHKINGN